MHQNKICFSGGSDNTNSSLFYTRATIPCVLVRPDELISKLCGTKPHRTEFISTSLRKDGSSHSYYQHVASRTVSLLSLCYLATLTVAEIT